MTKREAVEKLTAMRIKFEEDGLSEDLLEMCDIAIRAIDRSIKSTKAAKKNAIMKRKTACI